MKKIDSARYIEELKPYKSTSHKVWGYVYDKHHKYLDNVLKLDWNESTDIPKFVLGNILKYISKNKLRLNWYPDVNNSLLLKKLSRYTGMPEKNIQYFNGSDSALEYITRAYLEPKSRVVIVSPTYDNFRVYVQSCGATPFFYLNTSPFEKDIKGLSRFLAKKKPRLVYLVNPNNPTGLLYSPAEIEMILKKFPSTLFLIDEAYSEFCNVTCKKLIRKYLNLVITRTFTKAFGLGSFRLGYVIADESIISTLNKIRVGKGISTFAQIAGLVALDNIGYMEKYVKEVNEAKMFLVKELTKLNIDAKKTFANFILFKCKNPPMVAKLLENEFVFVRDMSNLPQLKHYIRVTVGDKKTTHKFLKRFKTLLKNHGNCFF
jgi:histidinol-phosphate aminotransferase